MSSPTGVLLAYHHAATTAPPKAIIIICHGLTEHSGRYEDFARGMASLGYHVYAHDHRGHGRTSSPDRPLGRFALKNGPDKVIDDVLAMRELAVTDHPNLPVILFGHSLGGVIALNTAIAKPDGFAAVAIWNSRFNTGLPGRFARAVLAVERMLKGSDVPSAILPRATFHAWNNQIPGHKGDHDWLSSDPEVGRRFADDPLCGFDVSVSMWDDVFELTERPFRNSAISALSKALPINLVGGRQDPATHGGRDVEWLARRLSSSGFSRVTCQIYPDMRHETLQEVGREAAMGEFADWCEAAVKRRLQPSG
nr:alpha/beta hydrolase [Rhizobium halophytocola]